MSNNTKDSTPWLVYLGKQELALVRELGWDSEEVIQVQHHFREGYRAVKAIRKAYEAPSSQESNS